MTLKIGILCNLAPPQFLSAAPLFQCFCYILSDVIYVPTTNKLGGANVVNVLDFFAVQQSTFAKVLQCTQLGN